MKKINIFLFICAALIFSSCIKEIEKTYTGQAVAELDAAVLNSNATGVTYPILARVPAIGRITSTGCPDSVLRRFSGNFRLRINLVGRQSTKDETVGFTTFESPISSISFPATIAASTTTNPSCPSPQTPSRAAATLAVSNAIAGTHYSITNTTTGKITIPANSSFGYIDIGLLDPGASTGARFIGIRLDSSGTILPSINYRNLGIVIDQR